MHLGVAVRTQPRMLDPRRIEEGDWRETESGRLTSSPRVAKNLIMALSITLMGRVDVKLSLLEGAVPGQSRGRTLLLVPITPSTLPGIRG